ncbi:uncharacterized protein LOC135806760, partial [Sycon ciliatum]|uniref:uncharacterized protein LOC135806760 n=1 Tax=Sycon ciliatum TaxID=27933 RepID=UPI0031F64576
PPCRNGGECVYGNTCKCKSPYTGLGCGAKEGRCPPTRPIPIPCLIGPVCVIDSDCSATRKCCNSPCPGTCQCPLITCNLRCAHGQQTDATGCRICACASAPICRPACSNGGTCLANNRCSCRPGFTGPTCNDPVTPTCSPRCRNGGTCIANNRCSCRSGFTGNRCQNTVPPTCNPQCENGGTCITNNRCSCPSGFTGSQCQNAVQTACRRRIEIHCMTPAQRQLYIDTYKTAYGQPALRTLLRSHAINFAAGIHTRDQFLPWHRWFILELENILLAIDSNVILPYWDWTLHSTAPWSAPLWGSAPHWYGGDGSGSCVTTGPFRSGQFSLVSGGCLQRDFTGTTPSALVVNDILSTPVSSFNDFELRVRGELHNTVHCRIHGTMCTLDAAESPDFFLHHGFIDKLWADYQARSTAHHDAHFSSLGSAMTAAGGHSAQDMIDLNNQPGGVCVQYEQSCSSTARQLRRAFGRVAPSVIAKSVPCQPQSLDVSGAVQQGQELFRVSASERSQLASFVSKQVCLPLRAEINPPVVRPERPRPLPGNKIAGNLGFNLNTLLNLATAKK